MSDNDKLDLKWPNKINSISHKQFITGQMRLFSIFFLAVRKLGLGPLDLTIRVEFLFQSENLESQEEEEEEKEKSRFRD